MAPNFGYRIGDLTEETTVASNDEMEWSLAGSLGSVKIKFKNFVLAVFAAFFGISFVSVKSYGAVGDGVTDDTTAIQSAINAVTAAGGGRIYLPTGVYKTTVALTFDGTVPVTFSGNGWKTAVGSFYGDNAQWLAAGSIKGSVIKAMGTNDALVVNGAAARMLQVKDMALLGQGTGTTIGLNFGIGAQSHDLRTKNVYVANFSVGLRINTAIDHVHRDLHVVGCGSGIQLYAILDDIRFFEPRVETCNIGWDVLGATLVNVYGGLCQSNTLGISFVPSVGNSIAGFYMDGTWFESNTVSWKLDATNGNITDLGFANCRDSTTSTIPVTTGGHTISRLRFQTCSFGGQTLAPNGVTDVILENTSFAAFDTAGVTRLRRINDTANGGASSESWSWFATTAPGATYAPDLRNGPRHKLDLISVALTINLPTHDHTDMSDLYFLIRQDGTGGRAISFSGAGGFHGTLSNTSNTAFTYTLLHLMKYSGGGSPQWMLASQSPWVG